MTTPDPTIPPDERRSKLIQAINALDIDPETQWWEFKDEVFGLIRQHDAASLAKLEGHVDEKWLRDLMADIEEESLDARSFASGVQVLGLRYIEQAIRRHPYPAAQPHCPQSAQDVVERVAHRLCRWRNGKRSDAPLDQLPAVEQEAYREQARDAIAAMPTNPAEGGQANGERVEAMREKGWMVAVHNDYRLNGEIYTFWMFTKGNQCVKGEGRTDAEALENVRTAIVSLPLTTGQADQPAVLLKTLTGEEIVRWHKRWMDAGCPTSILMEA